MGIYTRTGDRGETGLLGGPRVRKDAERIEAFGTVDELNAALGIARAAGLTAAEDRAVERIQHELFVLGAELATPLPDAMGVGRIGRHEVERLEGMIDQCEVRLPELRQFILPGGAKAAAALHLARCVCRRAERVVVRLSAHEPVGPNTIVYLNRLGDYLFVLARLVNRLSGSEETIWDKSAAGGGSDKTVC
jgi:cob(I)alamin adenosyltransferase